MDAAAPSAKPGRDSPLIPPNYVSLRHLQELRLKEKEQQERQRRREDAAVGGAKEAEAAAAPDLETKSSLEASCGAKERPFGGQQWVAVAHRLPPPPRGEGAAKKRDRGMGDRRGMKGSDDAASYTSQGGGGKAENKGKDKVSAGTKGESTEPATASLHGGKPEEKRKGKASGDQGTPSGTNGGPGESAEATSASPRGRVRPENKRKGKKGSGGRSSETDTTSAPAEAAAASSPQGLESDKKGKRKPSVGKRADAAPSSDSPDGKRAQPPPAAEGSSNRRSGGGHETTTGEAKSEGLGEKQPVVEVKAAAERKPRVVWSLTGPRPIRGGRGHGAARQHGQVWVPKEAAAAAAAAAPGPGLSGVAGL